MGTEHIAAVEPLVLQEEDRPMEGWNDARGRFSWRPLFSADSTPTDRLVTGVAELGEGGFLALHRHEQTETYYVTAGEGVVILESVEHSVRAGSTVFIPGSAEHGIRNTGTGTLRFFYALAADDFTDVEYLFS
ncbi:cupin domain-containing protein [Kocuria arenosa]|uniref:cupin domain-containing protein n=1 Tax=Kocuria arenosa TaxID=3071446 RepID=UPI0034D6F9B0